MYPESGFADVVCYTQHGERGQQGSRAELRQRQREHDRKGRVVGSAAATDGSLRAECQMEPAAAWLMQRRYTICRGTVRAEAEPKPDQQLIMSCSMRRSRAAGQLCRC